MRKHADWLTAFCDYASYGEAPRKMYFWVGVSAIAGALRRRVWIDQGYFRWYPNFYIILVAPPGIVSKSTTASLSMRLLRQVPGIHFGPDVVTWQALITAFSEVLESFEYCPPGAVNGAERIYLPMSAITIESSELGNLINPADKQMMDAFVSLWDGKEGAFEKRTKMSGNDTVVNPWINIVACTTPAWIAGNFPEYTIGGGFASRCVFVYAEKKEKLVAYPGLEIPYDLPAKENALVQDLEHIAITLCGEYELAPDTVAWGEQWYAEHWARRPVHLSDERFGGYIARKQTHIHKLAMVLAASQRDELVILAEDLKTAAAMVSDLEHDMPQVFAKIGRTDTSMQTDRLLTYIRGKGVVECQEAYRFIHAYFPAAKDFEEVVMGLIKSGQIRMEANGQGQYFKAL